jgi:hypothetical protein
LILIGIWPRADKDGGCIAHRPAYIEGVFEPQYTAGCSGHDEPELDPVSACTSYGGPFCIYPWYTQNADGSFSYGVGYPTTAADFGEANQFAQQPECGGPFGPNATYCDTVIVP